MILFDQQHEQRKQFLPGTRRSRAPRDTYDDYWRLKDRFGITRLANVTGLDNIGIPVFMAVRPNSRSLSVSQGKGADVDAARVSAMMESIELWHAERIDSPLRWESFYALRRELATVDLFKLPRAKGASVRGDAPRSWIRGFDILNRRWSWVPHELVTMNTVGLSLGQSCFSNTSNGLASGNHVLEAFEHGLCEVIERDAYALWMARGPKAALSRRIRLDSITDPSSRQLLAAFAAAEISVAVFDMTSDVAVPTYACAIVEAGERSHWRRLGVDWGCGTHLSPVVALSRALTEAAQGRLTAIAGSRDDNPPQTYADYQRVETVLRSRDTVFGAPEAVAFPATADDETDSFEGDLETMAARLQAVGIEEIVVLDLSKPDVGIPVVKVVVPGLEGPPTAPDYVPATRALSVMGGSLS
jgi:YcaO-like protein with predicted kinase domain